MDFMEVNLADITLLEAGGVITDLRDALNRAQVQVAAAGFIRPGSKVTVLLHRPEVDKVLHVQSVDFKKDGVVIHATEGV
jgi:hypothetical protein